MELTIGQLLLIEVVIAAFFFALAVKHREKVNNFLKRLEPKPKAEKPDAEAQEHVSLSERMEPLKGRARKFFRRATLFVWDLTAKYGPPAIIYYRETIKPALDRTGFKPRQVMAAIMVVMLLGGSFLTYYLWPAQQLPAIPDSQFSAMKFGANRAKLTSAEIKERELLLIQVKETDILRQSDLVSGFAKVDAWRPFIEAAAKRHGVPAEDLEAIALLESEGNQLAINPKKTCRGPFQFDEDTAKRCGLRVTDPASNDPSKDERIDAGKAAMAAALLYKQTRDRYGDNSYAIAHHHMGSGNLAQLMNILVESIPYRQGVDRDYTHPPSTDKIQEKYPTYAHAFFGSTPYWNSDAFEKMAALLDDSTTYYFKVESVKVQFSQFRENRDAFLKVKAAHYLDIAREGRARYWFWDFDELKKDQYKNRDNLRRAIKRGELVRVPEGPQWYFRARTEAKGGDYIGQYCDVKESSLYGPDDRPLYFHARPETIGALIYFSEQLRQLRGSQKSPAEVNSLVRDNPYQDHISDGKERPVHTYGIAFDLAYLQLSSAERRDIEFVLNDLEYAGLLSWKKEPTDPTKTNHYHVTVNPDIKIRSFFQSVYSEHAKQSPKSDDTSTTTP
jgi:hypothetical protein